MDTKLLEKVLSKYNFDRVQECTGGIAQHILVEALKEMESEARADEQAKWKRMVESSSDVIDVNLLKNANKCEHKEGQHVHMTVPNFLDALKVVRWQAQNKTAKKIFEELEKHREDMFMDAGLGDADKSLEIFDKILKKVKQNFITPKEP